MLTSEMIKAKAKEYGADICGIAPIERFADAPLQRDPKGILPNATCVLGFGFRVPHNYVIYSDDFGETWNVLGKLGYDYCPSKWGNEPKCEELPDGTVVLSSRKYSGRYFNFFTFSDKTYTTGSWGTEVAS